MNLTRGLSQNQKQCAYLCVSYLYPINYGCGNKLSMSDLRVLYLVWYLVSSLYLRNIPAPPCTFSPRVEVLVSRNSGIVYMYSPVCSPHCSIYADYVIKCRNFIVMSSQRLCTWRHILIVTSSLAILVTSTYVILFLWHHDWLHSWRRRSVQATSSMSCSSCIIRRTRDVISVLSWRHHYPLIVRPLDKNTTIQYNESHRTV